MIRIVCEPHRVLAKCGGNVRKPRKYSICKDHTPFTKKENLSKNLCCALPAWEGSESLFSWSELHNDYTGLPGYSRNFLMTLEVGHDIAYKTQRQKLP
jgi:hypothetical protein